MSTSLTLAKRLRALPDEQLSTLVSTRLPSTQGLRDFFDVADALLSIPSLEEALSRLPRSTLEKLQTNQIGTDELTFLEQSLLNVDDGSSQLAPELVAILDQLPHRLATQASVLDPDSTPAQGPPAIAAVENALSLVQSIDELTRDVESQAVTELARGGLAAADRTRLTELLTKPELDPLRVMSLAAAAGILGRMGGRWSLGENATAWRESSLVHKWLSLAQAWRAQLSEAEVRALSIRLNWGPALTSWVAQEYPLNHSWLDALLEQHLPQAELLGLSLNNVVTDLGREVVTASWDEASARVADLVPPYAEHVYVQHDFTIVAPGPLASTADSFMRTLCLVESRGLATTFRLTPAGVDRLLAEGMSAEDITAELAALSATELPQAVRYLIADAGSKFGSVRVRAHESFTTITASDPLVLQTIGSDRALSALGLKSRSTEELACAHPTHVVLEALREARYPVQLEDAHGRIVPASAWPMARPRTVKAAPSARPHLHTGAIAVASLVERLRGTTESAGSDDATWIARQIDVAIREKGLLDVAVAMPDGSTREFTVEPKGVSNGRVRARDRVTEVERTLPLASISRVRRVS